MAEDVDVKGSNIYYHKLGHKNCEHNGFTSQPPRLLGAPSGSWI